MCIIGCMNGNRTKNSGPTPRQFQDVRITGVNSTMVRRLKSVLVVRNQTLGEWFLIVAAREIAEAKKKWGDARD